MRSVRSQRPDAAPSRGPRLPAGRLRLSSVVLLAFVAAAPGVAQEKRPLTFTDLMRIRQIEHEAISDDGLWLAFTAEPDRGDPEVIVRSTTTETRHTIALGSHPLISRDGTWVAARKNPSLEARESAEEGDEPRRGMALLGTASGEVVTFEEVEAFAFSGDGRWLAYHRFAPRPEEQPEKEAEAAGRARPAAGSSAEGPSNQAGNRKPGTLLTLRELETGDELTIAGVRSFAFDEEGRYIAYAVADDDEGRDGLYVRDLRAEGRPERTVDERPFGHYTALTWGKSGGPLAFVMTTEDEDGESGRGSLHVWDGTASADLVGADGAPEGWFIPANTTLEWSDDTERLFFGWRPGRADEEEHLTKLDRGVERAEVEDPDEREEPAFDLWDVDGILEDRAVDVWHWLDPRINPQQKILWPQEKDRTYMAVHHRASGRTIVLGDPALPDVEIPENGRFALANTDVPYRREFTWMGEQTDLYVVDLTTGERTRIAERLDEDGSASLSPGGRFAAYYHAGDYFLHDIASGTARNVTEGLGVPFADEDHDYPNPAPGYGVAGWTEDDRAVLLYDKYDIWVVPTADGTPWCLTDGGGRGDRRIFRIVDTDPEREAIGAREELLLSSYHDLRKSFGFYRARADRAGVTQLLEDDRRFEFLAKAKDVDALLFTREDYDEFPDLWVTGPDFSDTHKVSDVNPQIAEFAWGTSELVEWESLDGTPLQGVVIKPGNYESGRRYPVLVYFYRFFSQRLHEFNEPAVNHRPSFPIYASNGYVVFLPDVRFEVGRPGFSSMKSVVPGVQHLIDIGLADPDAIGLHGHSWSGYQTAFIVTQTNLFATAIAGAPVGNMTSAYSGIRWESGLARQFQYEKGQSRLSGSLWEARDEYIDNSPVFFADRVETPLLILHGDVDDAVPWYQSIELYLALRRLGKEAVFLQYRDEPHHPQKYPNKLDWAMKMKEWLDHYLKGEPAPEWITKGVEYRGG